MACKRAGASVDQAAVEGVATVIEIVFTAGCRSGPKKAIKGIHASLIAKATRLATIFFAPLWGMPKDTTEAVPSKSNRLPATGTRSCPNCCGMILRERPSPTWPTSLRPHRNSQYGQSHPTIRKGAFASWHRFSRWPRKLLRR